MKVSEILEQRSASVTTIGPEATLIEAAGELADRKIGSLVVTDLEGSVVGILTERDIVRELGREGAAASGLNVGRVMVTEVVCTSPDDDVERALQVMTARHIRHLPVLDEGLLCGLVSLGDVLRALRDASERNQVMLADYITGKYLNG